MIKQERNNNNKKYFILVVFIALVLKQQNLYAQSCTAAIGPASPIAICESQSVQFNDISTGSTTSISWNFGDNSPLSGTSNPQKSFTAGFLGDTTYTVTLTANCVGGGSSNANKVVTIYKRPNAQFTANKTTVCAITDSIDFTITNAFDPTYTYAWDFGDLNLLPNEYNPYHKYNNGGTYNVQLTVTNSNNCNNQFSINNIVAYASPSPSFNITSQLGCTPHTTAFTNTTDTVGASIASWQWIYGNGTPNGSSFTSASQTYTTASTYVVTLGATNSLGCFNSTKKSIIVRTTPTADFTLPTTICAGTNTNITFAGSAGPDAIYTWDFDGGSAAPGTGIGPHATNWNTSGSKNVTLSVLDSGCTAPSSKSILVNPQPATTLSLSPGATICENETVIFTASPANLDFYTFYKNNIPVQSGIDIEYVLPSPTDGDQVYVTTTNYFGCTSNQSSAFTLTVNPLPIVTVVANANTVLQGTNITFTANPNTFTNYTFYKNGSLILQNSASNVYNTTAWVNGDTLTVSASDLGCTGIQSNKLSPVIVGPPSPPVVNIGNTTTSSISFNWLPLPDAIGYEVSVSINGGAYSAFGDPSSGFTGTSHTITGLNPGDEATIIVRAIGSPPAGNSPDSSPKKGTAQNCTGITFTINAYDTICEGENRVLALSGFNIPNPKVSWNGGAFALSNNSFTITPTSNSTVAVVVANNDDLSCDSVSQFFYTHVVSNPTASLSVSPNNDSTCAGEVVVFSAQPAGYGNYKFYNGATLVQNSNDTEYTLPTITAGLNTIALVTTYQACSYTTTMLPMRVLALPTVTLSSTPTPGNLCLGDSIAFTANPSGISNYKFYNRSTELQNSPLNTLKYGDAEIGSANNYYVIATDNFGCQSESSNLLNFNVQALPTVTLTCSSNDLSICPGEAVTFTVTPSGLSNYMFVNNSNIVQSGSLTTYSTTTLSAGNSIYVIGSNNVGCSSVPSNNFNIDIKPVPEVSITATDSTLCKGQNITLTATEATSNPSTIFIWSTGVTASSITITPQLTTQYTLNSILNGCVGQPDTFTVFVDAITPPVASAGKNTTICIGESYTFSGSGGQSFLWLPESDFTDNTVANPVISPEITFTYTLITSNLYCKDTTEITIAIDRCLTDITTPIPKAISPNGDGANDFFIIPDIDYFSNNSIKIYNRWGNIVYENTPYNNEWNGISKNGNDLPDATYYYILNLGNNKVIRTGYIIIQR